MCMEVLAPVGSKESLIAAVCSGADAVYFGAKEFNARRNATNFEKNDFESSVLYCKQNGVKCYLTLNILIKDSEINDALRLAKEAADIGVDGIIVQDLGLASLIKKHIKGLNLHASTQMSVHSAAALKTLKELGFTRVVPAREMSKDALKTLCLEAKKLGLEVEVFVHGALCMSLSGQCYFSAHLGGRSANRGLCAGTCRLPFSAEGGTGYDLSLKDLSLVNEIATLRELGVTSLKIEGRMKRPEYVAASVNCIKQAVENGSAKQDDLSLLEKVFSRSGFTHGYFKDRLGRNMFGVRTETDLLATSEALSKLHELYRRPKQRLEVNFKFELLKDCPAVLTATYGDYSVSVVGDKGQAARSKPLTEKALTEALSKLGGTPYFLGGVIANLESGLMLPVSAINRLKAEAIAKLDKKRLTPTKSESLDFYYNPKAEKKSIKGFFLRFASPLQMCDLDSDIIGYSLPAILLQKYESKEDLLQSLKTDLLPVAELSRGADDDSKTLKTLNKLKALGIKTVICSNLGALTLAKDLGFEIFGGFGLNLYNNFSLSAAKMLGLEKGIISPELSLKEQAFLSESGFESYAFLYGNFPLMLTKNCPAKNGVGCKGKTVFCKITDRMGEVFPVVCENGYSEILNSRPTNLADRISLVSADYGYLYFTIEEKDEVSKVLDGFKKGKVSSPVFTRGLSKSGVM